MQLPLPALYSPADWESIIPLSLVFIILGSKGNSAVRHAFNAVVTDRDPVSILPEIFDNGLCAIKRFLAVRNTSLTIGSLA